MGTARTLHLLALMLVRLSGAYRLPTHVVPEKYTLDIVTRLGDDADGFSYDGRVLIQVRALSRADQIVMHSKGLEILEKDLSVTELSESDTTAKDNLYSNVTFVPKNDFLEIRLSRPLIENHIYAVDIHYRGNLSEGLNGYYRSSYKNQAGEKRWLAVTHFEPWAARKAFPCFDEPEMKAQFQINLARREHYKSASNMPINTTEPMSGKAGWFWDRYEATPNMSTYLAAFMVADFRSADSVVGENGRVAYRIWARPEAIHQADYALEVGPKVLKYYEEYFNISYPLPKMDMAAIPDFSAGAMENWGLVTYRETALLYDPQVTSSDGKMRVVSVIAHELAHQWFGNLVTMKWWSDLWLNEGFATYVAALGSHHAHPEWKYLDCEAFDHLTTTLSLDALKSSRPISVAVTSYEEVKQMFDAISYQKGSALLRMMNHFLGESVFRQGLSNYLRKHQYRNAEQDDLWSSLTQEAHKQGVLPASMTVKNIMDTWTLYTGYPVVTVTRDYQRGTASLTQTRYLLDATHFKSKTRDCWAVPITYSSSKEPKFEDTMVKVWMTCDHETTNISNMPGADDWVIFNNRVTGLYRVQYDQTNWLLISRALNGADFWKINVLNRAQLLSDLMNFAWTGDVSYDVALGAAKYLQQEREYLPWRTALGVFGRLDKILQRTPHYHHFRSYLKSLLKPSVDKIYDISDIPEGLLEGKHFLQQVAWACKLQMGQCVREASELFHEWTTVSNPDTENPIARDLRSIVYCTAVKYGSEAEWNFVWDRYVNSNVPSEKITLLRTLGCTRETWLLRRCLLLAHTPGSPIRKQDSGFMFYAVSNNDVGYDVAKDYFTNNITDIYNYYQPNAGSLSRYIKALAYQMYTQRELDEWRQFLSNHEELLKESQRAVQQSVESVQVNVQWHRDHYQDFSRTVQRHTAT